jgi:hypothetical protein
LAKRTVFRAWKDTLATSGAWEESMLSNRAIGGLNLRIAVADACAKDGQLADGYTLLVYGLHAAKIARAADVPGGRDLVRRYQAAIEAYIRQYGVSL